MAFAPKTVKVIKRIDGLFYHPSFLKKDQKKIFFNYFKSLNPIFEMRYSKNNPPPEGDYQRQLLRPVYWLGNWQFACLNYYHPPEGILHRCLLAEKFPPFMQEIVHTIEAIARSHFNKKDIPKKWHLNTCLINFYGSHFQDGKKIDCARVGEHKDFEPGPVASISFGERAFFQFVGGNNKLKKNIHYEQWLDDCSLLVFGGQTFKEKTFHRVQRVESKNPPLDIAIDQFETRRINLTFRYVPVEHIYKLDELPMEKREDIQTYLEMLATHSDYYKKMLITED